MAYEIQTIGDVAQQGDPTPLAAQASAVTPASLTLTDRAQGVFRDVVAQRTGLLVGLAVGAAGVLLYSHMTGGRRR